MTSMLRRPAALVAGLALLFTFPAAAGATINGACTGEGHSTSTSANLTTDTEWHLQSDDVAGGSGTSTALMRSATVAAYGLGIGIPIAGGTSQDGETSGSVDGVSVSTYAVLGHRFVVAGSASGDGQCRGQIEIIIDDVEPLFTVLGGGGIILALIGLIGMLVLSRSSGGCANRFLSAIFGGMAGAGLGLALEQFEVLDPTQPFGLAIVVGLAIVGFITAGMFGGRGGSPAPIGAGAPPASSWGGGASVGGSATVDKSPTQPFGAEATPDPGPLPDPGPHERPGNEPLPPGGVGGGSAT